MARLERFGYRSRLMLVLLFVSVGMNALQARKIRDLVDPVLTVRSGIGQLASPLSGVSIDGQPRTITFSGGLPTVVYFFSPTCGWCERNWANVAALARASAGRYRVVGITATTDLKGFAAARGLDFEILGGVPEDATRALGLGGAPHTLVVSSQGRISDEWIGAFDGRRKRAVEDFFQIELPGLLPYSSSPIARR